MKQAGLSPGDTIRLSDGASEKRITPWQEAFKSRATDVEAVIPPTMLSLISAPPPMGSWLYRRRPGGSHDPDPGSVQDTPNWSRTVEEFNTDALSTVGAFLQPMHSMTYFILLLAAIGVINNLLINYMQNGGVSPCISPWA